MRGIRVSLKTYRRIRRAFYAAGGLYLGIGLIAFAYDLLALTFVFGITGCMLLWFLQTDDGVRRDDGGSPRE